MDESVSRSRRLASVRVRIAITDRDPGSSTDRASRAGVASTRDARGRRRRVIPSIHPSIRPSVRQRRARCVRSRARVRPRAEHRRARNIAARVRDDTTARERTESTTRGDSIRFVRASSIDRERTIDRPSIGFVSATDGASSTRGTIAARLDESAVVPRERRARTRTRTREARARDVVQGHVARGAAGGAHAGAAVRKDAARGAGNEAKRFDRDD